MHSSDSGVCATPPHPPSTHLVRGKKHVHNIFVSGPDSPGTHRVKEQCCALHRARIATTFCHSVNDIIDHAKLCFAVRESPPACPGQTSTRARPLPACPHPDHKTVSLDTMSLIRGRSSPMHARARPLFRTRTDMRAQPLARPRTAQPLKRHSYGGHSGPNSPMQRRRCSTPDFRSRLPAWVICGPGGPIRLCSTPTWVGLCRRSHILLSIFLATCPL